MRGRTLLARGIAHYWRTHLAVVLGVATGVAVLAGALIVGDSVRGSLRDLVVERLGRTDRAVLSTEFFREALADDVRRDPAFGAAFVGVAPLIAVEGMVADQQSGRSAARVQVYGVDDRFWEFHGVDRTGPSGRDVLLNAALASEISAHDGGSVIVRVEKPSAVPIESLHGRKDNLGQSLRLTVRGIVPRDAVGDFSLVPSQGAVRAAFVPLRRLQQDLDAAGRVNALLFAQRFPATQSDPLPSIVRNQFALADVGLSARAVAGGTAVAIESAAGVIDASKARAIDEATGGAGEPILTYLANAIRSGDRAIPYSLVTAMDLRAVAPVDSHVPSPIVLNEWAARDLGVQIGAPIALEYYVWEEPGRLLTRTAEFQLAAIVPIAATAADRELAPAYPGISDARRLGDWDPPFPIDLGRIRRQDEDYWDHFRTTPKAFVPLEAGRQLWRSRFGDRTSVRLRTAPGEPIDATRNRYTSAIRSSIDPLASGLVIRDVRAEGLAASRGATDFGEYFTYFSFFLVVSALMLASLFFRLGVEQRAREIGLLRSVGFTNARVTRLFVMEGVALAALGGLLGVGGAVAYGALMIAGLRTWWSGAVGTTALRLHVSAASLAVGAAATLAAAVLCIWWTLRMLSRLSERSLLAGRITTTPGAPRSRRRALAALSLAIVGAALAALGAGGVIDRTAAFFSCGAALLMAALFTAAHVFNRPPRSSVTGDRTLPLWRVGLRNAAEHPGRSLFAIGVIASASFIVIAVDAFRRSGTPSGDRRSGTGGYSLLVDLLIPIATDPNSADGREALGLPQDRSIAVDAFRVLPGDDASCLNLYRPQNPRVLGVPQPFIAAGRFAFQRSLAATDAERANPWLLLARDFGPNVVPVIADANSMTYVLHRSLGEDIVVSHRGGPVRYRIVAALADSIFQREVLMSAVNFGRLFPEQEGYRFLLVDAPRQGAAAVASAIERQAADLGADAADTAARLDEFHVVENTYLATFQALGGLGLLVGTIGLAAVVLRNVLERRRELALLGAVGYRRSHLLVLVLSENLLLLGWGLGAGIVSALVAIAPAVLERGGRVPATATVALLLSAVFVAGLLSSFIATRAALQTPLLAALRSE